MKGGGAITMISLLFVAVTSSAAVSGENEFVLDHQGNPVKPDTLYYVHHWFHESGTWLCPDDFYSNTSCPEKLMVASDDDKPRARIMFVLSEQDIGVRVSTELNIRMQLDENCSESGYWRVADSSSKIKEVVPTGSKSSSDSIFTIQRFDPYPKLLPFLKSKTYKFAFGSADNSTDISFRVTASPVAEMVGRRESAFYFVP